MTRTFTDQHIENMSRAQQNRKLSRNNTSGHNGICRHKRGGWYVHVADTYVGYRKELEEAIKLRDNARKRMMEYAR